MLCEHLVRAVLVEATVENARRLFELSDLLRVESASAFRRWCFDRWLCDRLEDAFSA